MKKVRKRSTPKESRRAPASGRQERPKTAGSRPLRIVGMGGSAGGLEAFEQFFTQMPTDSGMAFVLVPHLDPTHKGIMPELLHAAPR